MKTISRRRMIENTGLGAIPALFSAAVFPRQSWAQAVNNADTDTAARKRLFPINDAVAAWANESSGHALAQIRQGTGTAEGLSHAAKSIRVLALHLESTGIDKYSKQVAEILDPNITDYSSFFPVDQLTTSMQKYDPTYTRDELLSHLKMTKEETQEAKLSIANNGISWHFHRAADILKIASMFAPSASSENASVSQPGFPPLNAVYRFDSPLVHFDLGVYRDSNLRPHIEGVSFLSFCKRFFVSFFCGTLFTGAAASILAGIAGMTVLEACGYETAAAIITEVASEGAGTAGAAFLEAVCAAGMAAYNANFILSAAAIPGLVTSAVASFLTATFGGGTSCP